MSEMPPPIALTIAGSDSCGGAGIEADLKTFTALGVYGMAAVTSITAQNTVEVRGIHDIPPETVAQQIDAVAEDVGMDAVKTGMLSSAAIAEAVADALRRHRVEKLVVDPVMVSESGHRLLVRDAVDVVVKELLPQALVVTPNIAEAEVLTGRSIKDADAMRDAAKAIHDLGARCVLLKGGHMDGPEAIDYLYDGEEWFPYAAPRVATENTHGTGCTYGAAIAAFLAKGEDLREAVGHAKTYLTQALRAGFSIGHGPGPLNHFWALTQEEKD